MAWQRERGWSGQQKEVMFYGDYVHRFSYEQRTVPNFRPGREGWSRITNATRGLDAGLTLDILLGRSIVKFHPSESMLGLIDLFCQTERPEMGEMY